jgi:hypothetical protein
VREMLDLVMDWSELIPAGQGFWYASDKPEEEDVQWLKLVQKVKQ